MHLLLFIGAYYLMGLFLAVTEKLDPRWPLHNCKWFNWIADRWDKL